MNRNSNITPNIRVPYVYNILQNGKIIKHTVNYRLWYKDGVLFRVENSYSVAINTNSERFLHFQKHFGTWQKAQQEYLRALASSTAMPRNVSQKRL